MADTADIKSVEELTKYLRDMLAKNPGASSPRGWPERFSLKPVMDGQIAVTVPQANGAAPQNYTLWLQKGPSGNFDQFVLLNQATLNGVLENDVLNGVDYPIQNDVNPLTGERVPGATVSPEKVLRDQRGNLADFKVKEIWVQYDPATKTGTVVEGMNREGRPAQHWIVRDGVNGAVGSKVTIEDRFYPDRQGYTYNNDYNRNVLLQPGVRELFDKAQEFQKVSGAQSPALAINVPPEVLTAGIGQGALSIKTQFQTKPQIEPKGPAPAPAANETPAVAPPRAPELPAAALRAQTVADLAKMDFKAQLGNVALSHEQPGSTMYEAGHRHFYEIMNDLSSDKLPAYFRAAEGSPERAAAEKAVIEAVGNVPDGYKALAVGYVQEALFRKAPVSPDDYKYQGTNIFNRDDAKKEALDFLKQKEDARKPAEPVAAPPSNAQVQIQVEQPQPPAPPEEKADDVFGVPPQRVSTVMSNEQLERMLPPARIVTANDLARANGSALQLIGSLQATFIKGAPVDGVMTAVQIEEVLQAHEKAGSPFAETLRHAYIGMRNLSEAGQDVNPASREGIKKIFEIYMEKSRDLITKPQAMLMEDAAMQNYAAAQAPGGPFGQRLPEIYTVVASNTPGNIDPGFEDNSPDLSNDTKFEVGEPGFQGTIDPKNPNMLLLKI